MSVITVHDSAEFAAVIANAKGRVIVDCGATWCGPCRAIAPYFATLASQYADVTAIKLDVDEAGELAERFGVASIPTFIVLDGGKEVSRFTGASQSQLKAAFASYDSGSPIGEPQPFGGF